MRSTSAAALLSVTPSLDSLAPLARALGFTAEPLALAPDTLDALGLAPAVAAALIIPGRGALRALLAECPPGGALRDHLGAVATRLARSAPHLLWLVLAHQRGGREIAIATWSPEHASPRIAALVADHRRIVPTDAETVCALAAAAVDDDLLTHAGWVEVLGRGALSRRFYRTLERCVGELATLSSGRATPGERREIALLHVSRLLFLSFLEAKGWLDGDRRFLAHRFTSCMATGVDFHRRVLRPLFFGTLNTPLRARAPAARDLGRIPFLNGGLFARTPVERRARDLHFSDEAFGSLFDSLLNRYRFTAREESTRWTEAAIDPEMLGRAFESLMSASLRRNSGAFFTPQPLVARVTRLALASVLVAGGTPALAVDRALDGLPVDESAARSLAGQLRTLRLLDPACGSGAFLVYVLEELAALARRLGDPRPLAVVRRDVLTRSIFGVDVNPTAVWLCELRLWLSVVIESEPADPLHVTPLPNLDRHVRVGDSLAGEGFFDRFTSHRASNESSAGERAGGGGPAMPGSTGAGGRSLLALRTRYTRATGARKRTLHAALDRAERQLAIAHVGRALERCATARRDLLVAARGRDLFGNRAALDRPARDQLVALRGRAHALRRTERALREGGPLPFAFATHFSDAARAGGFDLVIGNPPWVRLHRIPPAMRSTMRARYSVFSGAAWAHGAAAARAGHGFAAQVDLAAIFLERSLALAREGGTIALLLPVKLWRALAGGGARRLVAERAHLVALEDWSEAPGTFDAAVYPSMLLARRRAAPGAGDREPPPCIAATIHRRATPLHWEIAPGSLPLIDGDAASPWVVAPGPVRAGFDRLVRAGPALAESHLGSPLLGVKCGCNDAFAVTAALAPASGSATGAVAHVQAGDRAGTVEHELLRPLLRGEHLARWEIVPSGESILWTHAAGGAPLAVLPDLARGWLRPWRARLERRSDVRGRMPWWALFRTASGASDRPRVVWADVDRAPRAAVLQAGDRTVPLNSCYVLPCRDPVDADTIAALLNSPLAAAWLALIAEPARGAFHRYLAWTVALLPLPGDWVRARALLAPLAARARRGDPPSDAELLDVATRAYRVRPADVAPLIAWSTR